jgi:hypothetical protein
VTLMHCRGFVKGRPRPPRLRTKGDDNDIPLPATVTLEGIDQPVHTTAQFGDYYRSCGRICLVGGEKGGGGCKCLVPCLKQWLRWAQNPEVLLRVRAGPWPRACTR